MKHDERRGDITPRCTRTVIGIINDPKDYYTQALALFQELGDISGIIKSSLRLAVYIRKKIGL